MVGSLLSHIEECGGLEPLTKIGVVAGDEVIGAKFLYHNLCKFFYFGFSNIGIILQSVQNSIPFSYDTHQIGYLLTKGLSLFRKKFYLCGLFFAPGKRLIYTPTGEVVVAKIYNHPQGLEGRVEHALSSGNLELVKALAAKDGAPIVTVTYSTASGSFVAGQIFHYVPYEYEPLFKAYIVTVDRN